MFTFSTNQRSMKGKSAELSTNSSSICPGFNFFQLIYYQ